MRDLSAPREGSVLSARTLADLLTEFQRPGEPLHGLPPADAERVFAQALEQLLLKAIQQRADRRGLH